MVSRALPNPEAFTDTTTVARCNHVIHASTSAKYHYPVHTTPYLLVANFNNTGHYHLNQQPLAINDKFFYFLNPGDRLEINFRKGPALETLLIQFSEPFIADWINYKRSPEERLLNDVVTDTRSEWCIANIPYEHTPLLRQHLQRIAY